MARHESRTRETSLHNNILPLRPQSHLREISVEGLFFDLDRVLYDESAWRRWLLQLVRRVGVTATCESFFRTFHDDYLKQDTNCEETYWRAMRGYLSSVGCTPCIVDEVVGAGKAKRRELLGNARPLAGVATTLARLSTSLFPLAVVCSSRVPPLIVRQRLHDVGLSDWFRTIGCITSVDAIDEWQATFAHSANELGAAVSRCAYVSADPMALLQAHQCSLTTIAFNAPTSAIADLSIRGFADLTQRLTCERARLLLG